MLVSNFRTILTFDKFDPFEIDAQINFVIFTRKSGRKKRLDNTNGTTTV